MELRWRVFVTFTLMQLILIKKKILVSLAKGDANLGSINFGRLGDVRHSIVKHKGFILRYRYFNASVDALCLERSQPIA